MYNKFFAFKEKPFKLVPNPEYLFLSKSHEEALAHLTYAISHGDGFVEITGEVGTGKTTLCRVFLENLDKSIEAAYIFNPKLDALQLLKAINDEFGIDSRGDNTKDLIDTLNVFLIEKKAAGQKVLVLIDEAQNLSLEVLEQLRLLSNLETTQEKLLQIILVGQPELGDMLSSHQLRQLGQRITINCNLAPLTFQETKDYIRHRISLASHRAGPPFDKSSYRAIYEYSKGVPRLINIACNRVLLNAFSRNSFKITGAITKEAIKELTQKKAEPSQGWFHGAPGMAIVTAFIVLVAAAGFYFSYGQFSEHPAANKTVSSSEATKEADREVTPKLNESEQAQPIAQQADEPEILQDDTIVSGESSKVPARGQDNNTEALESSTKPSDQNENELSQTAEPAGKETTPENLASIIGDRIEQPPISGDAENFLAYLKSLNSRRSRNNSMQETLKRWFPAEEIQPLKNKLNPHSVFFQQAAKLYGLQAQPIATDSDITLILKLDLPTVFTFYLPGHSWPKYLAVTYVDDTSIYFVADEQTRLASVSREIFLQFWSGEAYILWKDFNELQGIISERSSVDDIKSLKKLLLQLGYDHILLTEEYDKETIKIITTIQEKYGLHIDGIVGPFTKIALYNESREFTKPSLVRYADPAGSSAQTDAAPVTE